MNPRAVLAVVAVTLAASACGSTSANLPAASVSQTDIRVGTGTDATNGRTLIVHYTLWLHDPAGTGQKGQQLETSVGGQPFPFQLGAGRVIPGWDAGVAGMKAGGLRRLVIPPELAYGSAGQGSVPPNATLVFEIELLAVE
jgi:FKBP-type peptidyl-prolyl cis-trans isomerase FkpA